MYRINNIKELMECEREYEAELNKINEEQKKKLKEVIDAEETFVLDIEADEAYARACRRGKDLPEIIELAYDFWGDYKKFIWMIPGNENFERKWLGGEKNGMV